MYSPRMAPVVLAGLLAAAAIAGQTSDATAPLDEQVAPTSAPAPGDPWASPEVAAPRMDGDVIKRPQSSQLSAAAGESTGRVYTWLRTSASLAGVVALIVLLAWGYRLVTGAGGRLALTSRARQQSLIELLSRTNLAPRQSLYLVRVGPQLVLVGATHDSLRALSVIDDPDLAARLAGSQARDRRDSRTADFRRCLDGEAGQYGGDDGQTGRATGAAALVGLRERLTRTLSRLRTDTPSV